MLNIIFQCFYFIVPAYLANMAPVIIRKNIPWLAIPVDFGKNLGKNRIFGEHKTYRGLIFGVLFAIIASYLQFLLHNADFFARLELVDYSNWLLLGFLLGFGAMIGDLAKSFFKRRLNFAPGKPFIPFDQMDFIIGALIFSYPLARLSLENILVILALSFVLHIIVNHIAFYTGIRKEKW